MEKRSHTPLAENLRKIVEDALNNSMFTACSAGYVKFNNDCWNSEEYHFGSTGVGNEKVSCNSVYDLASLTKPLVVSMSLMALCGEGKIFVDNTLSEFFEDVSEGLKRVTVNDLLCHRSGLPAHKPFYKKILDFAPADRKKIIVNSILGEAETLNSTKKHVYSDLGFILLGSIIEKIAGKSLSDYWSTKIKRPLNLENDLFFPDYLLSDTYSYVCTGVCSWSNMDLSGLVNDDNCRALGGGAGHAGLFGTMRGVLHICKVIIECFSGKGCKLPYDIKKFIQSAGTSPWVFGFDTPSAKNSAAGDLFSAKTIGHLGYTGTSFWIDLEQNLAVVLLTNRVLTGTDLDKMKDFRRKIYNTIMSNIL